MWGHDLPTWPFSVSWCLRESKDGGSGRKASSICAVTPNVLPHREVRASGCRRLGKFGSAV